MDWDKLKVFHAAAEAGSFTHAGENLGLSQSAVSRQVSALEQELSVSLFHRHARGLILTEQGELLYRTAHDVFMKLESARAQLSDSREKPHGELTVTTTAGIGIPWPAPRPGRERPCRGHGGRFRAPRAAGVGDAHRRRRQGRHLRLAHQRRGVGATTHRLILRAGNAVIAPLEHPGDLFNGLLLNELVRDSAKDPPTTFEVA